MIDYGPGPFKLWTGPFVNIVIDKPEDIMVISSLTKKSLRTIKLSPIVPKY